VRIALYDNGFQVFDEFVSAAVHDDRPWFRLPGFVDTDIRFARAYACDSYGGRLLPEWLDRCTFPSEARFAGTDW
jgi:guanine deaminase